MIQNVRLKSFQFGFLEILQHMFVTKKVLILLEKILKQQYFFQCALVPTF